MILKDIRRMLVSFCTVCTLSVPVYASENDVAFSSAFGNISTNMRLIYDNTYYEGVILPNKIGTISIEVTNTGETKELMTYIARYDLSGTLIDIKQGNTVTSAAHSTTTETIKEDFSVNTPSTAKVFVWEKGTIQPLHSSLTLKAEMQDYYTNDFDDADLMNLTMPVCGIINTADDVDIVKIRPTQSGLYAIRVDSAKNTTAQIYDADRNELSEASSSNRFLFYSLLANKDYYIRLNGGANGNYTINPAERQTAETIKKAVLGNNGKTGDVDNDSYSVLSFTPTTSGTYIFTAVGTNDISGAVYGEGFSDSSGAGDNDVSFRVTGDLQANKTYYILLSSKSGKPVSDYEFYVEQPFDIVYAK